MTKLILRKKIGFWSGKKRIYKDPKSRAKKISEGLKKAYQEGIRPKKFTGKRGGFKKGLIPWNKNKKHDPQTVEKIKATLKGRRLSKKSEFKKGVLPWNRGLKSYLSGKNHYNWKDGVTPTNKIIRASLEYKLWRKAVFERDNYTCVWCGQHNGYLEADHIKPFAYFPEIRFAIDNGRTLCLKCHRMTDTWGGRYKNKHN